MSLDVGTLTATLKLDSGQFESALSSVGGKADAAGGKVKSSMDGAGKSIEGAGKSTAGLSSGLTTVGASAAGSASKVKMAGVALAGLAAGGAVVSFFRDSISAASDLNETMNKSNTIFGDSAGEIDKWGNTAAKSLGLSKAQALEAAANFGNMFTQLGFTSDAAADLSTQVVQMSADLGSFNNLGTDDVAERISAAFRGEYDSLQLLIPNISAARVEQEAMAETGKTSAAALTAQEKATAVLAIVQRDGAAAMGDFAKTSGDLANSQKIATAQFEDAKTKVGQGLLPVWQKLVTLFSDFGVPAIEALGTAFAGLLGLLSPVIDILAGAVKVVADLPGPLLLAAAALAGWSLFGTVAGLVSSFAASIGGAAIAVKGFMTSLGPIGILLAVVTTAMAFLGDSSNHTAEVVQQSAERWDRLKATLDGVTGAVTDATRAQLAQEAQSTGMLSTLQDLGISTKDYIDASAGVAGAQEKLGASVQAATTKLLAQSDTYQAVAEDLSAAGVAQDEFVAAVQSGDLSAVKAKVDAYAESVARSTGNASDATDIQNAFQAAVDGNIGPLQQLGGVLNISGDDAGNFKDAADAAAQRALALGQNAGGAADGVKAVGDAAGGAAPDVKDLQTATKDLESAASLADAAVQFLTASLDAASGNAVSAEQAYNLQAASLRGIGQAARDVADAQDAQKKSADEVGKAVEKFGASSDEAAAAQRDYEKASDDVTAATEAQFDANIKARDSALKYTSTVYANAAANGDLKGASDAATQALTAAKDAFIAAQPEADRLSGKAQQTADALFGIPKDTVAKIAETGADHVQGKAGDVTGALNSIPSSKSTNIGVTGVDSAISAVLGLAGAIDGIPTSRTVNVGVTGVSAAISAVQSVINAAGGYTGGQIGALMAGYSDGGKLPGRRPSDPTRDNLLAVGPGGKPIRLQSSEWVINSAASAYYGDAMMAAINSRTFPKAGGMAAGGPVGGGSGSAAPQVWVDVHLDSAELHPTIDVRVDGRLADFATGLTKAGAQVR